MYIRTKEGLAQVAPLRNVDSITDFITVEGIKLRQQVLEFCFFGTNAYYLMELAGLGLTGNLDAQRIISEFFDLVVASGIKVVRTWGFNEHQQKPEVTRTQIGPGQFGSGLNALDFIIQTAKRRGVYLIIPLVDYWPHYGGISQYARWVGYNLPMGNAPDHFVEELFYIGSINSNPTVGRQVMMDPRTLYLNYACHVINRYRNEPAILAWELMNEPRARAIGAPNRQRALLEALRTWIGNTARAIKQRCRPRQLLSIGGVEIELLSFIFADPNVTQWIDLVDTHFYPSRCDGYDYRNRVCRQMQNRHTPERALVVLGQAVDLAMRQIRKPFYLGEFGIGYYAGIPNRDRAREFQQWSGLLWNRGASGMLFWQLLHRSRAAFDPNEVQVAPTGNPAQALQGLYPNDASEVARFVNMALRQWQHCRLMGDFPIPSSRIART